MVRWLFANDLEVNNLPSLGYHHQTDKTLISHGYHNKVIHQEIWQIYTIIDGSTESLPSKVFYYKEHFVHFFDLGFIIRPQYLHMFLSHALRVAIGQLKMIISPT